MKKLLLSLLVFCGMQHAFAEYQFLFFYKEQNPHTKKMQEVFESTLKDDKRAKYSLININQDPALVQKYNLKHAPMPFVLVLADNGAIMGGLPSTFTKEQLLASFACPVVEDCLKALQDHKLVLLCVQNEKTTENQQAMQGVQAFKSDPKYASATEVIYVDPSDAQNAQFLQQLNVTSHGQEALTVFLAPPADVVGTYKGATQKDQFVKSIEQASSGCCPGGCCPGGCCPGGKCK